MKKTLYFIAAGCLLMLSAASPLFNRKKIEYFNQQTSNPPFSKAVKAGDMVYLSGVIGTGADGKLVTGVDAQAKQVLDNITAVLKDQGLTMNDVVKCTVMIKDMANYAAFNAIYRTYFKPGHFPARSAFGANGLAFGAEMEVEVIAYDPKK